MIIVPNALSKFIRSLSGVGLVLGTIFLAASLTPSLIPRTYLMNGVLAGAAFGVGYGIGVLLRIVWRYLELPEMGERLRNLIVLATGLVCIGIAGSALYLTAGWQNSVHAVMNMAPVPSAYPFSLAALATLTFLLLLGIVRVCILLGKSLSKNVSRILPRRLANVIGIALTVVIVWTIANGFLLNVAFRAADSSFREFDALIEPDVPQPTAAEKTGSASSLIAWDQLGRAGREFIGSAPTAKEIAELSGRHAIEPIRVYAGLPSGDTPEARANLALEELKRQNAFARKILVIITPTGTGWVDPAAINGLEFLHGGDVASVGLQYSYLSSPLALLFQPEYGADAARALFRTVYNYWQQLPNETRPQLYLYGLSLGAMHSSSSFELFEMLEAPIDGALWSGPPFTTRLWNSITRDRKPGSPEWLPVFRDGAFTRFMNQHGEAPGNGERFGPMRVVFLQYASDPVTFFETMSAFRQPDWMRTPRGPDVSPEFRWYPIVTMLQLTLDMAFSTATPMGYGHLYAPEHYVDAWVKVTNVTDWDADKLSELKKYLREQLEKDPAEKYFEQAG